MSPRAEQPHGQASPIIDNPHTHHPTTGTRRPSQPTDLPPSSTRRPPPPWSPRPPHPPLPPAPAARRLVVRLAAAVSSSWWSSWSCRRRCRRSAAARPWQGRRRWSADPPRPSALFSGCVRRAQGSVGPGILAWVCVPDPPVLAEAAALAAGCAAKPAGPAAAARRRRPQLPANQATGRAIHTPAGGGGGRCRRPPRGPCGSVGRSIDRSIESSQRIKERRRGGSSGLSL